MPNQSTGYAHFLDISKKAIKQDNPPAQPAVEPKLDLFCRPEDVRYRLDFYLRRSIENLDDELLRFENNFISSSNRIFWAADFNAVFHCIKKIFSESALDSYLFPQKPSITSLHFFQEIGLEHYLGNHHFHKTDNRGIRFFYADTMVTDSGSLILNGIDNNALKLLNSRGINVFFTPISQVLNAAGNAETLNEFRRVNRGEACGGTILTKGGKRSQNFLIIVDNLRSAVLSSREARPALTCINCGRCTQVCPVANVATEQAWDNVFSGPIANVLLPYLENQESYRHVAYACTMCGRCEEVCPMQLPLRDMMIDFRRQMFQSESNGKEYKNFFKLYRHYISSRGSIGLNAKPILKSLAFNSFINNGLHKERSLPPFEPEPFNKQYQKEHN